jgi:[ribosomal protein S5]-alanine N-acetyltransferase
MPKTTTHRAFKAKSKYYLCTMNIICETKRLLLRPFTLADAPLLLQLNSNPEVLKYIHEQPLVSIEDAERILNTIILPQYTLYQLGRWAMIKKEDGAFTGWCGLKYRPELNGEIDLGYRLNPEFWGKGYATEAATACLGYGFLQKNCPEITGRAHIENTASLKILQNIGLQYIKDEVIDDCPVKTFRLTREEYDLKMAAQNL